MCLAAPGKVLRLWVDQSLLMAAVDFSGVIKNVCLVYTPEAGVGDYVIVHAGFSISILDQAHIEEAADEIH
jgi:hydrogenase expression/formation protein HypC